MGKYLRRRPLSITGVRSICLMFAAGGIAIFSFLAYGSMHSASFAQECNTACIGHSQAGAVLTNLNKLKKNDNEPRPPTYPQASLPLQTITYASISLVAVSWIHWYYRRMLLSTQLRY